MRNQKKLNNFFVKSFGCQYNEFDATTLTNSLKQIGLVETTLDEADFVFVLNCSVRKTGVDRAMGFVRNLENKQVYLAGCLLEPDKKRFARKGVTFFNLDNLLFLPNFTNEKSVATKISKFIPIMKGCDNFCSYCVVPYTRGREVSRPLNDVIDDIKKVIASGQKEIWLLGQNVNSYKFGFVKLLEEINNFDGNFQIFFTSNHPKDMSDEIINAVATLSKVAKIVHLPVQSGSNKVLRSMNRPYTIKQYSKLVEKIKKNIPNVKITTDVIVGYPTETEIDFDETVELFNKVQYFQTYVNKYSPREGTAAHKLGDPIPWSEKERRWRILNEIANIKKKS